MKWAYAKINDITDLEQVCNTLTPSRKARIERIKRADARAASLAGEWLVRRLSGGIPVACEKSGRPYLEGCDKHISISHSGEYVACAISDGPVGIDIEKIKEYDPRLKDRVCTEAEREYVDADPDKFFEIWTAKEAYFKKIGTGITNFKSVDTLALDKEVYRLQEYIITIVK